MEYIPLSALCVGHQKRWIRVRASRVWHHRTKFCEGQLTGIRLVLVDEQGNSIYAMVPYEIIGVNIHRLHESLVYELSLFQVSDHSRYMNPVDNPLAITFTELTIVQPVHSPNDMFPEITYRLTSFADLPEPTEVPRHFLDVIRVIRAISPVATFNFYGTEAPISIRHVLLCNDSDNEIRVALLGEAAFRFNGKVIRFLGQEESAIIIFVGMTVHSREGSKELVGAAPCRWYINRDIQDINILRARFQSLFQPIAQLPIPRPMNRRRENDSCLAVDPLSSILSYNLVQNQPTQFRCNVKIWSLTPGRRWWLISCAQCSRAATPAASTLTQPNRYKCSDARCPCTDASLEYCLHLLGSDNTGKAEFNLRGIIAQDIVGLSLEQTILNNCPKDVPFTNLALAATQIKHTASELAAIVSWNYEFLIDVTANRFQASWASFNVRAVEACYPPE